MASGKLSPRQKMINMMYLVLIALLALNVSKDILKAFHMFELSFINANKNADLKNQESLNFFKASMEEENKKKKTEPFYLKALEVQKISDEFSAFVEKIKTDLITQAGGRKDNEALGELTQPDNMEKHANYFIPEGGGNGKKLQDKINETRAKLLKVIQDDKVKGGVEYAKGLEKSTQLKAEDPPKEGLKNITWVSRYLEHAPLAGVVTLLTKTQNDCKSLESEILTYLANSIDAQTVKFDKQAAMIIPESTNVMAGSSFKAKVALMAYNSTAAAEILVNGQKVSVVDGIGEYTQMASGVGSRKVEAKIQTLDPETGELTYVSATPVEWTSFMPSATISADAMNVLYIGLDNPMSISVPGVTSANTTVTAGPGLTLTKSGDGKFNAKVDAGARETSISVSARMPDGTTKPMGKMPFRIKQVPKPEAMLGSLISGSYPKEIIQGQSFLNAALSGFVYDGVKFTVTKYRVLLLSKKDGLQESSGSGNNPAPIKAFAAKAKKGDIILVDGIYARGPAGERLLSPLTFTIQ
ncbi:MAG: gliding motility protein GldM [Bacteroidota bacterium]|nr:gliding motility protein GldM [Bacteroidota bacterium]